MGYCFGDCHVTLHRQFNNIKLNRISFGNYHCRYGWRTTLYIDQVDRGFISGDFKSALNGLLNELSREGYYSVNVSYHAISNASGIYIVGCKNTIPKQRSAQQYAPQQLNSSTTQTGNNWTNKSNAKKESTQKLKTKKTAKDYVAITPDLLKSDSKKMYVYNKSSSRKISVTVEVSDYYGGNYFQTYYEEYRINPGEKKYIGSTDNSYPGSIEKYHNYYYKISGAYFSN